MVSSRYLIVGFVTMCSSLFYPTLSNSMPPTKDPKIIIQEDLHRFLACKQTDKDNLIGFAIIVLDDNLQEFLNFTQILREIKMKKTSPSSSSSSSYLMRRMHSRDVHDDNLQKRRFHSKRPFTQVVKRMKVKKISLMQKMHSQDVCPQLQAAENKDPCSENCFSSANCSFGENCSYNEDNQSYNQSYSLCTQIKSKAREFLEMNLFRETGNKNHPIISIIKGFLKFLESAKFNYFNLS